jgi:hypothetical protein
MLVPRSASPVRDPTALLQYLPTCNVFRLGPTDSTLVAELPRITYLHTRSGSIKHLLAASISAQPNLDPPAPSVMRLRSLLACFCTTNARIRRN